MIKLEKVEVMNIENAIRGARNPLNSWAKSDSYYLNCGGTPDYSTYILGDNDLSLVKRLCKAGSDHRKFLRQIFVSMDITAPMSWWWDFDTYKVSTTKNSCSRMHKLGTRLLTVDDFSLDDENGELEITDFRKAMINDLNSRITQWQSMDKATENAKSLWRSIVFDMPASYNFLSTWTGNYEVLVNVYFARKNHKQREFKDFCLAIEELPYMKEILDAVASGRKAD